MPTAFHLVIFLTQNIPHSFSLTKNQFFSDAENNANNGGDVSFNSVTETYHRFKGFVIDIKIWGIL